MLVGNGKRDWKVTANQNPSVCREELETGFFFFPLIESMSCYKFKSLTEGRISVKTPKSQVQLFQIRKWLWVAPILGKPHTAQGFIGLTGYKYCNKPIRVGFQAAQTAVRVFMYICVGDRGFEGG